MVSAVSAFIPSLAIAIVQPSLDCNLGICARVNVEAPFRLSMEARDLPVPSAARREVSVELEAREPIVILPGMNPNIDTRLPWNRHGPRVLRRRRIRDYQ